MKVSVDSRPWPVRRDREAAGLLVPAVRRRARSWVSIFGAMPAAILETGFPRDVSTPAGKTPGSGLVPVRGIGRRQGGRARGETRTFTQQLAGRSPAPAPQGIGDSKWVN